MLYSLIGWHPSFSALILRLALGAVFIAHGYPKLFKAPGPKGFAQWLGSLKIPAPLFFAYVVGIAEFFGGILLVLGLCTRLAALLIAVNMIVATWKVKFKTGLVTKVMEGSWAGGFELDMSLFAMAVALAATGAGSFSVDALLP